MWQLPLPLSSADEQATGLHHQALLTAPSPQSPAPRQRPVRSRQLRPGELTALTEEVANQGKLAVADELFAADFEVRDAVVPAASGPEGVKQVFAAVRSAFADFHETVEDVLADEDRVMVRWSARGTHQGPFVGIAPTGKPVLWRGVFILRVKDGRFVEMWQVHDTLGLVQQLGATVTPPAATG